MNSKRSKRLRILMSSKNSLQMDSNLRINLMRLEIKY